MSDDLTSTSLVVPPGRHFGVGENGTAAGSKSDDEDGHDEKDQTEKHQTAVLRPKTETKIGRPRLYKVLLLNDDYTPMDFVVEILRRLFEMSERQATETMLRVHTDGVGVCGVYSFEIAETKASQVIETARRNRYPLQCRLQRE